MIPRFLSALLACIALALPAHAETRFLARFDDMPLAPGLTERAEAGFVFSTPEGRIAEATATGAAEEGTVRTYYRAALPALGWSQDADAAARGPLRYVRGRERLTLAFAKGSDGTLTVRYRIVARPASLALP